MYYYFSKQKHKIHCVVSQSIVTCDNLDCSNEVYLLANLISSVLHFSVDGQIRLSESYVKIQLLEGIQRGEIEEVL